MTAVASPQPGRFAQGPEHRNLLDYVNAPPFRQPPPVVQLPGPQVHSSAPLRQELPSARGQERQPAELSVSRTNSKNSANSTPSRGRARGQGGQRTPSSGHSDEGHDAVSVHPNVHLVRASTDYGPRRQSSVIKHEVLEENWELRHGWEDQYNSTEYLGLLSSVSSCKSRRHLVGNIV